MCVAPPVHHPWVGTAVSLFVPGAGVFLSGRRKAGIAWFCGLIGLSLANDALAPLPFLPGVWHVWILGLLSLVMWVLMLVKSGQPIPHLDWTRWLGVALLCPTWFFGTGWLSDRLLLVREMPSPTMTPTIHGAPLGPEGPTGSGDILLIQRTAYWFAEPARGDIVIFRTDGLTNTLPGQPHLRRVVGLPGEVIRFRNGKLEVNGQAVANPPVFNRLRFGPTPRWSNQLGVAEAFTVPSGRYFVVGDNATNSLDSRHYGPVPLSNLLGRATKIILPLSRAGDLN
jgi:signal peptidase I